MPESRVRIRRGRRTDFIAVMQLLAESGVPVPPPDRATLRRFRNIVADLGSDLYLAIVDETLAGIVHVTYARQLATAPQARLDQLVVANQFRRRGIGSALLRFARDRARRHGCGTVSCPVQALARSSREFLANAGLHAVGEWFVDEVGDVLTGPGMTEAANG